MNRPGQVLAALVALGTLAGCNSEMVLAAGRSDHAALRREIGVAESSRSLHLGEAADIASVVIDRGINQAPSAEYALARLRDVRGCAFFADDQLARRMRREDAVGGEAALERLEVGALGEGSARRYASSPDDRWRAVGMWGMTRDSDHDARLRGLVDGSPLVRRAALHAIATHEDPADFDAVYDAARLDPEPLVRTTAVRTLSSVSGDRADVANKMRDLWTTADDGLREDIASVYASHAVFSRGGRDALFHILSTEHGTAAIGTAGVVVHGPREEDAELRSLAEQRLAASIGAGSHRERLHAIAIAPLSSAGEKGQGDGFLVALRAAAKDEDVDVRIAALGRLVDAHAPLSDSDHDAVVHQLEGLGYPGQASLVRGSRARWLLAEAGDLRVQAWLESDLHAPDPYLRISAADGLAALGRAARAAPVMADDDPEVRTRGACAILNAERR